MKKCDCTHIGQCPARPSIKSVYEDNTPIYRSITFAEAQSMRFEPGDVTGMTTSCRMVAILKPLDRQRAIEYKRKRISFFVRCRADSFWWRLFHPIKEPKI